MMFRNFAALLCAPFLLSLAGAVAEPAQPKTELAYTLTGEGKQTIVFEAGFGADESVWKPVLEAIEAPARLLTYSRAGLGNSPAPSEPMTIEAHLKDLEGLLSSLDIEGSVILVGHSYGGLLAAEYTATHKEQVSALVLIDPATRGQRSLFRSVDAERVKADDIMLLGYMPPSVKSAYQFLMDQMDKATSDIAPLPADLPVVLFTSTKQYDEPFVFEETDMGRKLWLDIHKALISNSRDAVHVRLPNVDHNIHKEAPERIAGEIGDLARRLNK